MLGNALDSMISVFSPKWAANRIAYRAHISQIKAASGRHEAMEKLLGGRNAGGYEAGKSDRLKGRTIGSAHENDVPRHQVKAMRWRSWNLYRNCPQARKIVRSLRSKVIGRGLSPQPQATTPDGKPFVEFRKRARNIWEEFGKECDFRGKPGSGGQRFVSMAGTSLQAVLLSGGVLFKFHHLDARDQRKRDLSVPLQVQLLHSDRLDEEKHDDKTLFYGVQLDAKGRVEGYWVLKGGAESDSDKSEFVPVAEMKHLYAEEDIEQILGASWFSAALLTMDDRRSYEYNELVASEAASCVVAGYRRSSGQVGGMGLQQNNERDLTDADGNPITRLQPMMFLDLGSTGEIELLNPQRPNNSAGEFLSHLIRSEAVSMPGVKSSTLTGDYRNSSFSSERSADNDVWPEIEEIQDWFATGFCQPIYVECITAAVVAGLFDDIEGFSAEDFNARKREYLKTNWQGPVPRSINPKDDADAAARRVKGGVSTPQLECGKVGTDLDANLDAFVEVIAKCKDRGLPDDIWQQMLGIEQRDFGDDSAAQPSEEDQDEAFALQRFRANGFSLLNKG